LRSFIAEISGVFETSGALHVPNLT
jgi:hypothetical protein